MSRVLPPVNQAAAPTVSDAKNNPVSLGSAPTVSERETYETEDRILRSRGDASEALDKVIFDKVTEQPYDDEKMAMLAFMNEDIEIRIATATDPNAEQIFEITVNGRSELFRRGEVKTVKRYYADRMMRLKETRWRYEDIINSAGEKDIKYIPYTALKYDFAITRDLHPLSRSWQEAVMREAG